MENNLEKYAELLVRTGINIQEDQILVITSPIECADFARLASIKAYESGAKEVVIRWIDEQSSKIRFDMAKDQVFDEFPEWIKTMLEGYAKKGAAFLSIAASDPELMKDVDPKKMSRQQKVMSQGLEAYRTRMMNNQNVWCVASIPTVAWAKKVFPGGTEKEALDKLWEAIYKAVRVDRPDPVAAWEEHQQNLNRRLDFLNNHHFKALRYKNAAGTDLVLALPENHRWVGGGDQGPHGKVFFANMPTEEVFTMPKADGVDGTVVSSMPLNYNGNLIEDFRFTFSKGKVVDFDARQGKEVLKELLDTDDGAKRLGEIALVPYDSPISNQKILFYNTLFDENASCHFALGKAYPSCIKGGDELSKEALKNEGANDSLTHVDFMIGTEDLSIVGITEKDEEVPVFEQGNFVNF